MLVWALSAALAGDPGWVRQGPALRGEVAVVALQVEGFEGGLFEDPDGARAELPVWPDVDLGAVAGAALAGLHEGGTAVGLRVVDAPLGSSDAGAGRVGTPEGFVAIRWHEGVPGPIQRILATAPGADMVLVVRFTLGWCPTEAASVMCVRAHETALGRGLPGALGYAFSKRVSKGGSSHKARKLTLVARRYRYTRHRGAVFGDAPILGRGETAQEQAEDAAHRAMEQLVRAARGRTRR